MGTATNLLVSVPAGRKWKSEYGELRHMRSILAALLAMGSLRACNRTPHKASAIRGVAHSANWRVTAFTPPHDMNMSGFNTPGKYVAVNMALKYIWQH